MACNNSGKTFVESLTTFPGGTAANANYLLSLDHYLCQGRRVCINEAFPITADVKATTMGQPVLVPVGGVDQYCQEVLISGTCSYMPYTCGCNCNQCPVQETFYTTICVPCSSAAVPTVTVGTAAASPTNVQACCNVTNCVAITCTLNVATGA